MATISDTVWPWVLFTNRANEPADPDSGTITLQFYDSLEKPIDEPIPITNTHRLGVGEYEYPYVVPPPKGAIYFEFSGSLNGYPATKRGVINRRWIG